LDHIAELDPHCRRLLSRLYRDGPLSKRDLRDPRPEVSGFHPGTLKNHLQHLEDQCLVIIEHVKNSKRCRLTDYGEKVAPWVMANETGIPVALTRLDLLLDEANSNPPTLDDFAVNLALPSHSSAHASGVRRGQIKLHKRRPLWDLDWYCKGSNLAGIETLSLMENLANLSTTSVRDASADLVPRQDSGWEAIFRGTAKLPPPTADPGLNPNDWAQIARRKFELDSTFKEFPTVKLPQWFEQ
jgi:hypothetical protein